MLLLARRLGRGTHTAGISESMGFQRDELDARQGNPIDAHAGVILFTGSAYCLVCLGKIR